MTEHSLADWLCRLERLHPKGIDLGLDRVRAVADRLNLLPVTAKTVIVAGTNGKGSVVSLLQAGLLSQGFSVGTYLSPHLVRYNERIVIDGQPATDASIVAAFAAIDFARGDISLTYFEFGTLAALWLCRESEVDWQVLEVGLGGRLDAINIVDADVAVITSIGLDHQEWLGPDRDHIAIEKAHVARAGLPCVVLEPDLPKTLLPALDTLKADVILAGRDYFCCEQRVRTQGGVEVLLPLPHGLLSSNVAGALQALECMGLVVDAPDLIEALGLVCVPGRRQVIHRHDREWVLDVAHNHEAAQALATWVGHTPSAGCKVAIYATLSDKPFHDILATLEPSVDQWFFPRFGDEARSVDPETLIQAYPSLRAQQCDDFESAFERSLAVTSPGDRVLIFGSFVTVGAALKGPLSAEVEAH